MAPPRHIRLDQQAVLGSCTSDILASGSVVAVKLGPDVFGNGLVADNFTNAIDINVDNVTLEINSNVLRIKSGSITPSYLNINSNVDFNNFQGLDFRLENITGSDPAAGHIGRVIWRSDLNEIRIDTGSFFVPIVGGTGITQLTGDVTASGTGSVVATISNGAVTPSKISTTPTDDFVFPHFIGIGTVPTTELDVNGTVQTKGFRLTTGAISGYVLTSDASGNGTWQASSSGHTIEDHGSPLPQRSILNFLGTGVSVTDGGTETDVTINSGSANYAKDLVTVVNVISDHTIVLSHTPVANSELVVWNGLVLKPGVSKDYTIVTNVVILNSGIILTVGDELEVVYAY